jgi:hypothetical protein
VLLTKSNTPMNMEAMTHFNIRLDLDPPARHLEVGLELDLVSPMGKLTELNFYLHRGFEIKRLDGPEVAGYAFVPALVELPASLPQSGMLFVRLKRPVNKGEKIHFEAAYSGTLTGLPPELPNQVDPEWAELGAFLPWFPYGSDYGSFTYEVEAICPEDYQLRSAGPISQEGRTWRFRWDGPTSDIVICSGRGFKTQELREDECVVRTHYLTLSKQTALDLTGDLCWALKRLDGWFDGEKRQEVSLIETQRQQGGGYSRPGLIVLDKLSDTGYAQNRESYLRYMGHEAALLWWSNADHTSWENWLNVSFAEYSALLLVKEKFGEASFFSRLAKISSAAAGTEPIWNANGLLNNRQRGSDIIFYKKGPLLLNALSARIGEESFFSLCRTMIAEKTATTIRFLELLSETAGDTHRDWMETQLKTR